MMKAKNKYLLLPCCLAILVLVGIACKVTGEATPTPVLSGLTETAYASSLNQIVQQTVAAATAVAGTASSLADNDNDGLNNAQEVSLSTDPNNPDTDLDGLPDGQELNIHGTDPKNQDSDGDTLTDGKEVNENKTSPTNPDTDGDSVNDGSEIAVGSDPLKPDTDQDGVPDGQDAAPLQTSTPAPDLNATAQAVANQTAIAQTQAAQLTAAAGTAAAIGSANATATAKMALTQTAQAIKRIAYVYKTDLALANTYKTHLEPNNYQVDVIQQNNVASTNFEPYWCIIIGPDTGNPASCSTNPWGDPAGSEAGYIDTFGRPIIGLGRGGSLFFEARNLFIDFGQSWVSTSGDTSVYVQDTSHKIWTTPNSISIPGSQVIALYDNNSSYVAVYLPGPVAGVTALGRQSDNVEHYQIIMQDNRYLLWGFDAGPSAMSNKGKKVFTNAVKYFTTPTLLLPGPFFFPLITISP